MTVKAFGTMSVTLMAAFVCSSNAGAANLARILSCTEVPRAEERLQCFDAAARQSLGLGEPSEGLPESQLREKQAEIEARERLLSQREAAVAKKEALIGSGLKAQSVSVDPAGGNSERESALAIKAQELAVKEAELLAREEKLSAKLATRNDDVTLFGIPLPFTRNDALNRTEEAPNQKITRNESNQITELESTIRDFSISANNQLIVVLANGQVWRQMDSTRLPLLSSNPKSPHTVRISRGPMGSFNMQLNGMNRVIKARRIDGAQSKP